MTKGIVMTIVVEQIAFGKVWTTLDTMPGVVDIKLHGVGPKKKAVKTNGKGNGKSISTLILEELLANSPKAKSDLITAVEKHGKSKASVLPLLYSLRKKKLIIGKSDFKITRAGIKAATTSQE